MNSLEKKIDRELCCLKRLKSIFVEGKHKKTVIYDTVIYNTVIYDAVVCVGPKTIEWLNILTIIQLPEVSNIYLKLLERAE